MVKPCECVPNLHEPPNTSRCDGCTLGRLGLGEKKMQCPKCREPLPWLFGPDRLKRRGFVLPPDIICGECAAVLRSRVHPRRFGVLAAAVVILAGVLPFVPAPITASLANVHPAVVLASLGLAVGAVLRFCSILEPVGPKTAGENPPSAVVQAALVGAVVLLLIAMTGDPVYVVLAAASALLIHAAYHSLMRR